MGVRARARRHRVVAVGGLALVAVLAWATLPALWRDPRGRPTMVYCTALAHTERTVGDVRSVILDPHAPPRSGTPGRPPDLPTLQLLAHVIYAPTLASEGPRGTDRDVEMVLSGLRTAIAQRSVVPLDDPRVVAAARRVDGPSERACRQAHLSD